MAANKSQVIRRGARHFNDFYDVAKNTLDEWIYFCANLSDEEIANALNVDVERVKKLREKIK